MLHKCTTLIEIKDNFNMDTKNAKEFCKCESLKTLPYISNWDMGNVITISHMFSGCTNLKELPLISKWDTGNAKDISNMFSNCSELKKLPDKLNM